MENIEDLAAGLARRAGQSTAVAETFALAHPVHDMLPAPGLPSLFQVADMRAALSPTLDKLTEFDGWEWCPPPRASSPVSPGGCSASSASASGTDFSYAASDAGSQATASTLCERSGSDSSLGDVDNGFFKARGLSLWDRSASNASSKRTRHPARTLENHPSQQAEPGHRARSSPLIPHAQDEIDSDAESLASTDSSLASMDSFEGERSVMATSISTATVHNLFHPPTWSPPAFHYSASLPTPHTRRADAGRLSRTIGNPWVGIGVDEIPRLGAQWSAGSGKVRVKKDGGELRLKGRGAGLVAVGKWEALAI